MTPSDPPVTFTWNPADYHQSSAAQLQWAKELIAKLGLAGNERVLDIGCGDGKITAEIARSLPGGTVTGVDSSPEMIRFAQEHFPCSEYRNLSFIPGDARALPFSGEFDVVFSNAALHWISDHRLVLAGIAKSLRPGGKLLIQMGGKGNAGQVLGAGDVVQKRPEWVRYFAGFSFTFGFFGSDEYPGVADRSGVRTVTGRADREGYDLRIPPGLCSLDPDHMASLAVAVTGEPAPGIHRSGHG